MSERPSLYLAGSAVSPDSPSALFQQLCTDYPELPRRIVGEILDRAYRAAQAPSSPDRSSR